MIVIIFLGAVYLEIYLHLSLSHLFCCFLFCLSIVSLSITYPNMSQSIFVSFLYFVFPHLRVIVMRCQQWQSYHWQNTDLKPHWQVQGTCPVYCIVLTSLSLSSVISLLPNPKITFTLTWSPFGLLLVRTERKVRINWFFCVIIS